MRRSGEECFCFFYLHFLVAFMLFFHAIPHPTHPHTLSPPACACLTTNYALYYSSLRPRHANEHCTHATRAHHDTHDAHCVTALLCVQLFLSRHPTHPQPPSPRALALTTNYTPTLHSPSTPRHTPSANARTHATRSHHNQAHTHARSLAHTQLRCIQLYGAGTLARESKLAAHQFTHLTTSKRTCTHSTRGRGASVRSIVAR